MEDRYKSNLTKGAKKNGLAVLICTMIITVSTEILTGCSIVGENAEDSPSRLETEDLEIKDIQAESIQTDEFLQKFGGDFSGAEQLSGDYAVSTGNITIALYESKQHITDRLNENGLEYSEYDSDIKYSDSVYNKYTTLQVFNKKCRMKHSSV